MGHHYFDIQYDGAIYDDRLNVYHRLFTLTDLSSLFSVETILAILIDENIDLKNPNEYKY